MSTKYWIAMAVALAGCASSSPVPSVRFANVPVAERVDDRRDVPKPPAPRVTMRGLYQFDGSFLRLITRPLELPQPRRALGVNALDEVPDSTWFTNRIGVRKLSLDELRAGPVVVGSPEPHLPWVVVSGKNTGIAAGFTIVDARGQRFLLKLEQAGFPETETAAAVIVSKLLWASGYNVPEDHVVYFRPRDIRVSPTATKRNGIDQNIPLDRAEVDRMLAAADAGPDGRIRALASRILDGKPLGGHASEGVRKDDPNDRIPHELRRDLRGSLPIHAWLDHSDVKEDNMLDMWVADPVEPSRHYVKHYFLDFGKSLGFMATAGHDPRRGYAYVADYPEMFASLITIGLRPRAWESRSNPALRGVGLYDIASYDPGRWKAYTPVYLPLRVADRIDNFWGAKILIRFTPAQLRAVVETARLTDPRSVDYLVTMLIARQRATAKYWFDRVNPLDRFRVAPTARGHALCFQDLALEYQLTAPGKTRYLVTTYDAGGRPIGKRLELRPVSSPQACTPLAVGGSSTDGYTMVRVETVRPGFRAGTIVHLARNPVTRMPRVIGLWRL